jgi:hypothetical protein
MADRSGDRENQNRVGFHMMGMPAPSSLRTPGVMSATELAARVQVGKNRINQLVTRFSIWELPRNAKIKLTGFFA